jgi:type VI secretion system protein ImpG
MDPRLIDLYNDELLHLQTETAEFAREYPERAARLAIDEGHVEDPYVGRLLEGVAFLAARVRLKLENQYPVFTQQLLEILFPGWLAPTPSACVLQLAVAPDDPKLPAGVPVPRGALVTGSLRGRAEVRCEFVTTQAVTLWPLRIAQVRYAAGAPDLPATVHAVARPLASVSVELELLGEADLDSLPLDRLALHVARSDVFGSQLLEQLAGRCVAVGVSTDPSGRRPQAWLEGGCVRHMGFAEDEGMLPMTARGHAGFRVLKEYAALPEKFRFVEVAGLRAALRGLQGRRLVLTFCCAGAFPRLEGAVRADALALFCVPAVNLRDVPLDRVDVTPGQTEFHLVPQGTGPRLREIVQVTELRGGGSAGEREFRPIYDAVASGTLGSASYYTVRRQKRKLSRAEERDPLRRRIATSYPGGEVFVALSEPKAAPYGRDLQFLAPRALCSNRDLPLYLRAQFADAAYVFHGAYPVKGVECIAGPTLPLAPAIDGYDPWVALSHLFVNHLSLADGDPARGAEALRAMLGLYASGPGHFLHRQADGLLHVAARPVTRRIPGAGPISFGRGIAVDLAMSDRAFDGGSPFLLASALEHYLAAHVSINSFVETRLFMTDRAEELTWPTRMGRRPTF